MKDFDIKEELKRTGTWTEYTENDFKIVKNNGTKFLLKRPQYCVVDDVDENLGSVEASHHEFFDYFEVIDYTTPDKVDTLDLTWMNPTDSFEFRENEENQKIKSIIVNFTNLNNSGLSNFKDNKIKLVIKRGEQEQKTKASFISQLKAFNTMTHNYCNNISQLQLDGFNPLTNKILTKCAQSHNIKVTSNEMRRLNEMRI